MWLIVDAIQSCNPASTPLNGWRGRKEFVRVRLALGLIDLKEIQSTNLARDTFIRRMTVRFIQNTANALLLRGKSTDHLQVLEIFTNFQFHVVQHF
jgi:hypothetical protein